jgi:hypothetical protein
MSGYGTKKRGATLAEQLTFPAVFSEAVAQRQNPYGYLPQQERNPVIMPVGDDLQDKYHEQKRLDANRRVMNAVMDNRASTARFLRSHQNYDVPKAVLAQRQFANPSNGNQSDIYSHRPINWTVDWDSTLQGGVLFTQEGQRYGRDKLKDRVAQLNAIDVAKQEFLSGLPTGAMAQPQRGVPPSADEFTVGSTVELMTTLQTLSSAIQMGNITQLSVSEMVKFLRLLFRWATGASQDELEEVFEVVDNNIINLQGLDDEFSEGVAEGDEPVQDYTEQLLRTMRKVRDYLEQMIGVANLSPKERKTASTNAIKSAGLTAISRLPANIVERERKEAESKAGRLGVREQFREAQEATRESPFFADFFGDKSAEELRRERREAKADARAKLSQDGRDKKVEDTYSSSSSSSMNTMRADKPSAEMEVKQPEQAEPDFEGPAQPAQLEPPRQLPQPTALMMVATRILQRGVIGNKDDLRRDARTLGLNPRRPTGGYYTVAELRQMIGDTVIELVG